MQNIFNQSKNFILGALVSSYFLLNKKQQPVQLATQTNKINTELKNVCIFSGRSNKQLAKEITDYLGLVLSHIQYQRFADGEIQIKIEEDIGGKHIFLIQSTSPPVNENFLELFLTISSMKRFWPKKINLIMPYFGYTRQDKFKNSTVAASDMARYLELMGVDRVICVNLHFGQIQGYFPPHIPVDNLDGSGVALRYFLRKKNFIYQDLAICSPNPHYQIKTKEFAEKLQEFDPKINANLALVQKFKLDQHQPSQWQVIGNVKGKNIILIDDAVRSGKSIIKASKALKKQGAQRIYAFAIHGVFLPCIFQLLENSPVKKLLVTNTIAKDPLEDQLEFKTQKIRRLSIAPQIAEAIKHIQLNQSISPLFSVF